MNKNKKTIPYGRQFIDEQDIQCVIDVLNSEWLTSGPVGLNFELEFSKKTNSNYSIACSSGTAALHLAALALGLGEQDIVIVPAITFAATANAVRYCGANVVFCDVEKDTGLISIDHLEKILHEQNGSIKAVFLVHLNGQSPDLQRINVLANKYKFRIVEDACHAIGGSYIDNSGKRSLIGSCEYSDITIFSLHPVKTITAGEGGVVNTNNKELKNKVLRLRNHGITRDENEFEYKKEAFSDSEVLNPWYYEQVELGFNYRLSDINSALAFSQLRKLNNFYESRKNLSCFYDELLESFGPLIRPIIKNKNSDACWHLYPVLINFDNLVITRSKIIEILKQEGILTQVHYIPVYKHPYYRRINGDINLINSEYYYDHVLSLPLFVSMTNDDVKYVVSTLAKIVNEYRI